MESSIVSWRFTFSKWSCIDNSYTTSNKVYRTLINPKWQQLIRGFHASGYFCFRCICKWFLFFPIGLTIRHAMIEWAGYFYVKNHVFHKHWNSEPSIFLSIWIKNGRLCVSNAPLFCELFNYNIISYTDNCMVDKETFLCAFFSRK